jgi:hypothetical protein
MSAGLETVRDAIVEARVFDPDQEFCLIRERRKIYGYFAFDDEALFEEPLEGVAKDHLTLITPNQIVPGSTYLLDAIPLFQQHFFFFVLTRNDITHMVSFLHLDKLPMRLCLFSLLAALESAMTDLFLETPETHLRTLPNKQLQKARNLCQRKYGKDGLTPQRVLLCTELSDKIAMLVSSPHLFNGLPFKSKREGPGFFEQMRKLRNSVAHGASVLDILRSPKEFDSFIRQLRRVTERVSSLRSV